jgi:hypothetical protein
MITLIDIDGKDDIGDIDLLSYPWICHELAHDLLSKHDAAFPSRFLPRFRSYIEQNHRRTVAHRGTALSIAKSNIEQLIQFWSPERHHSNWAHECAMDLIGLWTCGPAYLAAFQDIVQDQTVLPFIVGRGHPPYEARTRALLMGAQILGWFQAAASLEDAMQTRTSMERPSNENLYNFLTSNEVLNLTVAAAFETCQALRLPRLTPDDIEQKIRGLIHAHALDLGTDLLVAAWLIAFEGDSNIAVWQERALAPILDTFRQ